MSEYSKRVLVSGGPGAGKTTLLNALGLPRREDQARGLIRERIAAGLPPRPSPKAFAEEILRREIASYRAVSNSGWVFFDRGIPDALGLLEHAGEISLREAKQTLAQYPYHAKALLLPPWQGIYQTDEERDQTFAQAVEGFTWIRDWYQSLGYECLEIATGSLTQRVADVRQALGLDS